MANNTVAGALSNTVITVYTRQVAGADLPLSAANVLALANPQNAKLGDRLQIVGNKPALGAPFVPAQILECVACVAADGTGPVEHFWQTIAEGGSGGLATSPTNAAT